MSMPARLYHARCAVVYDGLLCDASVNAKEKGRKFPCLRVNGSGKRRKGCRDVLFEESIACAMHHIGMRWLLKMSASE